MRIRAEFVVVQTRLESCMIGLPIAMLLRCSMLTVVGATRMADDLTFVINPEEDVASLGLLLKSLEDIRRLLRDVDMAAYGVRSRSHWLVQRLESRSPAITVRSHRSGCDVPQAVASGVGAVTAGTDRPPRYFSEQAPFDLQRMKRLFSGRDRARSIVLVADGRRAATIDKNISEQVDRILTAGYRNLGSLQGSLEAIDVHSTAEVTIWDRISGSPVRCAVPREQEWISRAKDLLDRRVSITGNIRYFANGTPRSVSDVTDIEDATPDPSLPRAEFGSIPDEGVRRVGAAEWLSSVRRAG